MNRSHLIDKVVHDTGVSKTLADRMIDSFIAAVVNSLKREEKVVIKDFGSWEISTLKPRNGTHPQTGQPMIIKAKKRPRFTPGKRLNKLINHEPAR